MKQTLLQIRRKPLASLSLVVLLFLFSAFCSTSFVLYSGLKNQLKKIDSQYTTLAVPVEYDLGKAGEYVTDEDGTLNWTDGTVFVSSQRIEKALAEAKQPYNVLHHCMLAAHTSGLQGVTSGALDPLQYVEDFDASRYDRCVMALECTEIDYVHGRDGAPNLNYYEAQFNILQILSRMNVYDLPFSEENIEIFSSLFLEDGSFPFEAGHKYLVRGDYADGNVTEVLRFEEGSDHRKVIKVRGCEVKPEERTAGIIYNSRLYFPDGKSGDYTYIWDEDFYFVSGTMGTLKNYRLDIVNTDEYTRGVVPEDSLPFFAEYTGDLEDFLASEEGRPWVEEIIPECQLNYESATVILTDNLYSFLAFNTGDASLLEGRSFLQEEYDAGQNVCLVSASYAQLNQLSIGDTINLDYYHPGYYIDVATIRGLYQDMQEQVYCSYPLTEETHLGIQKDYTIVGIYTAPESAMGLHALRQDMIFVPKASVPGAEQFEDPESPFLNSILLKNGEAEAFESYLVSKDAGGYFYYTDQNFGAWKGSLEVMLKNALRLMALAIVMLLLAQILFLYLSKKRFGADARTMRLLGMDRRLVERELVSSLFFLAVLAILPAGLASVFFYRIAAGKMFAAALSLPVIPFILCLLVQLAVMAAGCMICGYRMVRGEQLMRKE